jgi:hypothetical protein
LATIYQRILQDRFELLAPALRQFLGDERGGRVCGGLSITKTPGRLNNLAAAAMGIPPAGDYDLLLEVLPYAGGQRWVRYFGTYTLVTTQKDYRGMLIEYSGPASIGFELVVQNGSLFFHPRRAWLMGIPLPLWLAPRIEAENQSIETGGWRVCVRFGVPLLGLVAQYEGNVMPLLSE